MAPRFYKVARIVLRNSFGKKIEENITAEEYSRKYGSSDNKPKVYCPGKGYDGDACEAELYLSYNNGTPYFAAKDKDDHKDGCRYFRPGEKRIQTIPEKCLPVDTATLGKTKVSKDALTSSGDKVMPPIPEDGFGFDDPILDGSDVAEDGVTGTQYDDDMVYGRREGEEKEKKRMVLEKPRTIEDITKTMLSSDASLATKDGHMIEDQIFCRRTADYFLDSSFKPEENDCFILIGEKYPSFSIEFTKAKGLDKTIIFRNPYNRDVSTLFAIECASWNEWKSLKELIKRDEGKDVKRFALGVSYIDKKNFKYNDRMYNILFFKLNDIKYATAMTQEMDKLDREF